MADLLEVLPQLKNEMVLTHVSRRTHIKLAKRIFEEALARLWVDGVGSLPKVEFFMDYAQRLRVNPGRAAPFTVEEPALGPNAE